MPGRLQSRAEATASSEPLGDQRAGESATTEPISCCAAPSGAPVYSAYVPVRSLRNARRFSIGLHCGSRSFAPPSAIARAPLPSGATIQIVQRLPSLRSNASNDPSCDQLGLTFSPSPSNAACASEPSSGTTRSCEPAVPAVAIASDAPSGDHTGPVRSDGGGAMPLANGRTFAPLAAATASTSPCRNAICVPSGDQDASTPGTPPIVRSDASRTLVDEPVSTSRSPLPGRKPRAPPAPMMSTSLPRTVGV